MALQWEEVLARTIRLALNDAARNLPSRIALRNAQSRGQAPRIVSTNSRLNTDGTRTRYEVVGDPVGTYPVQK